MKSEVIERILSEEPRAIEWSRKIAPEFTSYAESAFDVMCGAFARCDASMILFRGSWVHARKMAGLAVLSALRQHRVESAQNLRQVIEMTSLFGYVAHFPDIQGGWAKENASHEDIIASNEWYRRRSFDWITANHPDISADLAFFKNHINRNQSHGTLLTTGHVYSYREDRSADARFFDVPDPHEISISMLMCGRVITASLVMLLRLSQTTPVVVSPNLRSEIMKLEVQAEPLRAALLKLHESSGG